MGMNDRWNDEVSGRYLASQTLFPRAALSATRKSASRSYRENRLTIALSMVLFTSGTALVSAQNPTVDQINCSDPQFSSSPQCQNVTDTQQPQRTSNTQRQTVLPSDRQIQRSTDTQQIYVDSAGSDNRRSNAGVTRNQDLFPPDPVTDFQRLARSATGEVLPIFGRDMFQRVPSTFAPADHIPVTPDYVIGPDDELLVRLWGPETFNSQLTVDTTGSIYIPKVGAIHVAGLRFSELQKQIGTAVSRIYRNYDLSVDLGHLRSIQVYVVGEARRPGAYTISSLSTVLHALFVSGGPSVQGSLRKIQVRRESEPAVEFDLYDFVLLGDKSKDIRLKQGDTIYIPAAGPQIALAGSVRHPAIYETRGDTSIAELLQYAGGYTPTAVTERMALERIGPDHVRKALTVAMDADGRSMALRDGDVLFVNHISPSYEKSVTIRGNLANPGRFPWHEGMRLSEIIPDRKSLLTNDYWRERNRLGVPVPLFEPLAQSPMTQNDLLYGRSTLPTDASGASTTSGYGQSSLNDQETLNSETQRANAAALAVQSSQLPSASNSGQAYLSNQSGQNRASDGVSPATAQSGQAPAPAGRDSSLNIEQRLARAPHRIEIPAPEIDWSYAVVERLDPATLKSTLLPFNLGKLVQDQDPAQNLELQPGDIVTILSQADVPVPLDEQTKFVRLEGEFASAGVYSVRPNETLDELVRRAGGLSPKAYLYGSSFLRESARVFQQQRLDEYIATLAADMERSAAVRTASSATGVSDPNALAQQRSLIAQLRQLRATGRVVLEFQPNSMGTSGIPKIALENGDVFRIPSRPSTVNVIGAVYGQNVFLYDANRRLEDYISLAGKPNRNADRSHAFIIRADGSIYSRDRAQGIWTNHFDNAHINPGDSIVVPEKQIKPTVLRQVLDYSQILASFGLAAGSISVIYR
jgi:polysaccharide biosynthesis/export protein